MKELKIILVSLLIILPVFGVYRYTESQAPEWTAQARIKTEIAQQTAPTVARQEIERAELWTGFYRGLMGAVIVGLFVTIGVLSWKQYDQRQESWARAVDGAFPMQQFSNGQVRWSIDPNKQMSGATGFQIATGALGEFSSAAGHDRQLVNNLAIQKTRTASAMMTGDSGPKYAAHAKLLAGAYDRNEIPQLPMADEDEPTQLPVFQPMTAIDAFNQSDSNRWVLGQSPTTGELFELNPKEAAHYGIVGATGTGKTAFMALLLMAYAIRNKYRVVVADGKCGNDWSKYQHIAEYTNLDYSNVGGIVSQMMREYQKRQALLNEHGVNSIWELPSGVSKPRPTLFIFDEFGSCMDSLKAANKDAYKVVELNLGNFLRLSRGAGLYVVLCDQNPSKWPGTVRANMPVNLCFRLGGGIGASVQEYNLDKLERVGQFQVSNEVYNAFKTYDVIGQLLPDASYKKPVALLILSDPELRTGSDDRGGIGVKIGGGEFYEFRTNSNEFYTRTRPSSNGF